MLPLLITWLTDRLTKQWATKLDGITEFGPITFILHQNHGAILGLFSDLPAVLRIVSLATCGAFLLCSYAFIQYLLPIKSLKLRVGLSILIGGIIGNVTDRIIWGYVVDFVVIGNLNASTPAFNLADALQWVGYLMILWAFIVEGQLLWPETNYRRQYWVNLKFQLRYCFLLMAVGASLTLISAVFSYTYLRVTIVELVGNNDFLINKFLVPYLLTYSIICVAFCAILFAVGRLISHRIAGPLYAFEKFLDDLLNGTPRRLKLRAGDEFTHLEELADGISERVAKIRSERAVNVAVFKEE